MENKGHVRKFKNEQLWRNDDIYLVLTVALILK